ncbi:hypothetical protein TNCV_696101 [Trichonephila clavipes]|nr:hypothetical protein TNCV_696101 [Trichonephila clavipes]
MRESIMYVKEDESFGSEKRIQWIRYGIKQKQALLNDSRLSIQQEEQQADVPNMVYALPSLQWLLQTVFAYSEPAGATFLAEGVPIRQSASV